MSVILRLAMLAMVLASVASGLANAQRWVPFSSLSGATFNALAVSTVNPQIIVTAAQGKTMPLYTTDGGTTWQDLIGLPAEWGTLGGFAMVPGTEQTLRVIFDRGIYVTSNFGASYTEISKLPNTTTKQIITHPTNPEYWFARGLASTVLRSTNAGERWDTVFTSTQAGMSGPFVSAAAPGRMYLEVRDTMFESLDTGRTWQRFTHTSILDYSVELLAADVDVADRLYGDFQGRIGVSTDRGRTWSDRTERNMLHLRSILQNPTQPEVMYALGTNIHRSTNRGMTWETIDTTHTERLSWALVNGVLTVGCYESGIFRASADGMQWTRLDRGINRLTIRTIIPRTATEWYVQGVSDVFKTTNAGETWSTLTPVKYDQPSGGRVYSFDVSLSDPNRMVGGTNSDIYRSTDGGITWLGSRSNEPIGFISIHPTNPDEVVCGGLYNLKHSTDGGATWKNDLANSHRTLKGLARSPQSPSNLMAGEEGAMYSSADNGATWTKHTWQYGSIDDLVADAKDGRTFYVAVGSSILITTNHGETWAPMKYFQYGIKTILQDPNNSDVFYVGYGSSDLHRYRRLADVIDTLYNPSWMDERYGITQLAMAGSTILAASPQGLIWFDPTPVSVQQDQTQPSSPQLYPNPASDHISITLPEQGASAYVVDIIDIHGRVLRSVNPAGDSAGEPIVIDVSGLPHGLLLARITSGTRVATTPFVRR